MKEVDDVIEKHGGWPGAFTQGDGTAQDVGVKTDDSDSVEALVHPMSAATYQMAPSQLLKAAEPEIGNTFSAHSFW